MVDMFAASLLGFVERSKRRCNLSNGFPMGSLMHVLVGSSLYSTLFINNLATEVGSCQTIACD